jgi:hypothetical protein
MRRLALLPFVAATVLATPARADEPDAQPPSGPRAPRTIDRTWLYGDDARVAEPLAVVGTTSLSYTNVTSSPARVIGASEAPAGCSTPCNQYNALAGNTAVPGATMQAGGEVGLLPRVSVLAAAQIGLGGSELAPAGAVGAVAGLRLQLLPSEWRHLHLALSGGYLRQAWQGPAYDDDSGTWHPGSTAGANGAWGQIAITGDAGPLRLGSTVHAEHVFADYRDGIDLMVQAGASYRVAGPFRAGVEYVGQDLEETITAAAEGGARHLVGPVASLQLLGERLTLVSGPALGLTTTSPTFVYRLAASYGF